MTARPAFLKQSAHHTARLSELHAALEESANRRSGPGEYEPPLLELTAQCGCYSRRDRDGIWAWDSGACEQMVAV
jgi:hypothetical protein